MSFHARKKIAGAKEATALIIDQLRQGDVIAIVTYDHHADILLPARAVTEDTNRLKTFLQQLSAGGQTALFNGIEMGVREIRQFWSRHRVNRLILLSDGLANVGPSSPEEFGELVNTLNQKNIAMTTIGLGLGYNEDLMTQLACQSDGNHAFAEQGVNLISIFNNEFKEICAVTAQEVNVTIICMEGVRPLRVWGRDAQIQGTKVSVKLNQLYSEQEKYILLELEVAAFPVNPEVVLAGVAVVYRNMSTQLTERISCKIVASFTNSLKGHAANALVMSAVAEQLAAEKNNLAIQLRDQGKIAEAQQILWDNACCLAEESVQYRSRTLQDLHQNSLLAAQHLDPQNWQRQRKLMREQLYKIIHQQKY
ncbi:MAG: VWA domain-containing protein [Thioploca sp.]|nr:VWA domain-containing protein [Thioploca sp.]